MGIVIVRNSIAPFQKQEKQPPNEDRQSSHWSPLNLNGIYTNISMKWTFNVDLAVFLGLITQCL